MKYKIMNLKIDSYNKDTLLDLIKKSLKNDKKIRIAKINTEFIQRATKDKDYLNLLNSFEISIADGRGVLWAAKYLTIPVSKNKIIRSIQSVYQMIYSGASIVLCPKYIKNPIPEAIPGVDAFKMMMQLAMDEKVGVFIFGSPQSTLETAVENIKKEFPKLKVSGILNGYDFQKDNNIDPVKIINNTDAKILIVALGSPKQENWINDNIEKLKNIRVAVGEGGTLTRIAVPRQKAPRFINKIGLEWFWRLLFNKSETASRNRFQRTWNAVPVFICNLVRWKIKND